MTQAQDPTYKDDIALIRRTLEAHRRVANQLKWGGWYKHWEGAKAALEALKRIEADVKDRQMQLPI